MGNNNLLSKQDRPQEFELVELLFQESEKVNLDIKYPFQERFQSYINQISSYLHSSCKQGFFTHFFFGIFSTLLDTKIAEKLGIKKLSYCFESSDILRIVAETGAKTHVFIFAEDNNKALSFSKSEYNGNNNNLDINVINIKKSNGKIHVTLEKNDVQSNANNIKQYYEITKKSVVGPHLESKFKELANSDKGLITKSLIPILTYLKEVHDCYKEDLPYGNKAREANDHGFVAGVFNNFRYRENAHTYIEQLAGRGYADIILLVRGANRSTKSIPIIIELKAGIREDGTTTSSSALEQAVRYHEGFQPNNMRMLSFADSILCVGMNLDLPKDSFFRMEVKDINTKVIPLIQGILDDLSKVGNKKNTDLEHDIISKLKDTYKTFPGIQQMSTDRYMSRHILGESIVLKSYDKHIFLYDEVYSFTRTTINHHNTRSRTNDQNNHLQPGNDGSRKRKVIDDSSNSGSKKLKLNAINTILFIPTDKSKPAILLNIMEANIDVPVRRVKLDIQKLDLKQIDPKLFKNMKVVQLDIQFNIGKSKESFDEYCNIKLLKSYDSVTEYNIGSEQIIGSFHVVEAIESARLMRALNKAVTSQSNLPQVENEYKQLFQKIKEEIYPIKSLIEIEAEFHALFEGILKYYSDIKLYEDPRKRALVITEFQTGTGDRIDLLVQAIGSSAQGTKEYVPVGLELKYDDTIQLSVSDQKKDKKTQKVKLEQIEQKVLKNLLSDQIEKYAAGAAIKSITDANDVIIIGIVFNKNAKDSSKLLLTADPIPGNLDHSSIWTTQLMDCMDFTPEWFDEDEIDAIKRIDGDDLNLLSLAAKGLDDNTLKQLEAQWIKNENLLQSIDSLDLSYNFLSVTAIKAFTLSTKLNKKLTYLDISGNSFKFTDDSSPIELNALKEIIQKVREGIELKISDIEMSSEKACEIIKFLSQNDKVSHLEMHDLKMSNNLAHAVADYIAHSKNLNLLDLSHCGIDDDHAKIIIDKLNNQDKLEKLILIDNKISAIGAGSFEKVLPNSAIYHLDLSNNPLGMDGFKHIVDAISQYSKVEVIKLGSVGIKLSSVETKLSRINPVDISYFEKLFRNTNLKNIDISYNDIGNKALTTILDILSETSDDHSLKNLKLAGNTLDTKVLNIITFGVKLGDFLKKTKVEYLYLANMGIHDGVYHRIAPGLQENKYLISLDLSRNHLSDLARAKSLAKAVAKHESLKHLNLSNNRLHKDSFIAILQSIQENTVLSSLNLSDNNIFSKEERELLHRCGELCDTQDELTKKLNENTERLNELLNQYNNKVKEVVNPRLFNQHSKEADELFKEYNEKIEKLFEQYNKKDRELFNQYNKLANPYLVERYINHKNKLVEQYIKEKNELVNEHNELATPHLVNEYNKQKDELSQQYKELDDQLGKVEDLFAKTRDVDFQNLLKDNRALKHIDLSECELSPKSVESLFALLKEQSGLEIVNIKGNTIPEPSNIVELLRENLGQELGQLKSLKISLGQLDNTAIIALKSLSISLLGDDTLQLRPSERELKIQELLSESTSSDSDSTIQLCLPGISRGKRSTNGCKIGWEEVDEISKSKTRNTEEIIVDAEKCLKFIKPITEEEKSQQLVRLVKEIKNKDSKKIVGEHKELLNKVIKAGSYTKYIQEERMKYVGYNIINDQSISPKFKLLAMNAMGKMQLMRGIHSVVATCDHGTGVDCSLSTAGLGFAFLSHPIEKGMSHIIPKMMLQSSYMINKVVPKIFSYETKSIVQIAGVKYGTKIGAGLGAAIGGIFDIIDIARSSIALIECNKRAGGDYPCGDKEIRDNIVSIGFSGVGFVSGIAFVVTGAPGIGIVVGFALMVGQGVYLGVSNVIEYHEKYHTTLSEEWSIFWRTALFRNMAPDVQHLAASTDAINNIADYGKKILESNPQVVAFATGLGAANYKEKCFLVKKTIFGRRGAAIRYDDTECSGQELNITPDYIKINMRDHSESNTQNISRVIPNHIDNIQMICLPKITNADYEKGSSSSLPIDYAKAMGFILSQLNPIDHSKVIDLASLLTDPSKIKDLIGYTKDTTAAIYYCENAMVLLGKEKINSSSGDKWILYDLRYANKGEIIGSNALNNEFSIFAGEINILGGANTNNRFNLYSDQFQGRIDLAGNSTNTISVHELQCSNITMKYTDDGSIFQQLPNILIHRKYNMYISICGNTVSVYGNEESSIVYVGREGEIDHIDCLVQKTSNIDYINDVVIDSLGGKSFDKQDIINNCNKVIVSPNTKVISNRGIFNNNGTFWIKYGNYTENFASSIIEFHGNATVIFSRSLLQSQLSYFAHNNTLSIYILSSLNSKWQLNLVPYIDRDSGLHNFQLINFGNTTVAPIFNSTQNVIDIDQFQLFGEYDGDLLSEAVDYYERNFYSGKNHTIFGTIKFKNKLLRFGSSKSDVISINEDTECYVKGGGGSDTYIMSNISDSEDKDQIFISNKASDKNLDILILNSSINSIERYNDSLLINNYIVINNYMLGAQYRHIVLTNDGNNLFIPYLIKKEWAALPFYLASFSKNVFVLSSSTQHAVFNIDPDDVVLYKQENDLLLTDKHFNESNSYGLHVTLKDYYKDNDRWLNNALHTYNDGEISKIDLNNVKVSDINPFVHEHYYNSIIADYVVDPSKNKVVEYNPEKICVVIFHSMSFDALKIETDSYDLVLLDSIGIHTSPVLTVKNWYKHNKDKILILEFSEGLESERFYISNESEKKIKFNSELSQKIVHTDRQVLEAVINYLMLQRNQQEIFIKNFLQDQKNRLHISDWLVEGVKDFINNHKYNNSLGEVLLLLAAKAYNKLSLQYPSLSKDILQNDCFNGILLPSKIQEIKDCINLSTNFNELGQFIDNNKENITKIITKLVVTLHEGSDNHHKHRHHHGEHVRVRRDIEDDESNITRDNPDTIIESQNDVELIPYSSSSSDLKPVGYNVINWIRSSILHLKLVIFNHVQKISTNWVNVDDKGSVETHDFELKDGDVGIGSSHLLEIKYKADELSYWSIGNNGEFTLINNVNYNLLDTQGNLLLLDLLIRKKKGVKYGNRDIIVTRDDNVVDTEYAQNLAYSAYLANFTETNNESSFYY